MVMSNYNYIKECIFMSNELLQRLENSVENAIETIEMLRLQIEDLEDKRARLIEENQTLKAKQSSWEHNLSTMLEKLENVDNQNFTSKEAIKEKIEQPAAEVY